MPKIAAVIFLLAFTCVCTNNGEPDFFVVILVMVILVKLDF